MVGGSHSNVKPEVIRVHPEGRTIPHSRDGNTDLLEQLKIKRKAQNAAAELADGGR